MAGEVTPETVVLDPVRALQGRAAGRVTVKECKGMGVTVTVCEVCGSECSGRASRRYCSPACKQRAYRNKGTADYGAASITIKSDADLLNDPRYDWLLVERLAELYHRDVDFVRRSIQACRNAGVSPGYFIARYLIGDKSVPLNADVDRESRLLQRKDSRR
jgi:hypothetical protein